MDLALEGKKALVCGASKGLGFAVAESLLKEGAQVAIAARTTETLEAAADSLAQKTGNRPAPIAADLTQPNQRKQLIEKANRHFGALDILVSNTGGPPIGPFLSHGPENWQLAIDLTLGSVTHLCALVVPNMQKQGFGRIAQIVSIAGLEVVDGLILSNASRPAVLGFARALSREVAPYGILVNSICPGLFMTDRVEQLAREQSKAKNITVEQYLKDMVSDIPLGRLGDPREVGDLAAFLCSPRNTYITGAAIPIEGGKMRRLY